MASEYLIKTVNEYEDYIKNHEIDGQVLNAYVMATQTAICTEHDIKYGVKVSNRAKEIINYLIKKQSGGTFAQLEDFAQENKTEFELINIYYKLLKMEAPDVLDSYMLYVEKNRKRRDRFYEPRRKTLKLVTDKLQLLEDDELDELFVHMPARVGKSQELTLATSWKCARNTEASNLYDHRTKKYRNIIKNRNDALCMKFINLSNLKGKRIEKPIIIHYRFYVENKMHDRMNTASAFIKSFEDALQKCRIICNDGYDDVLTPTLYFEVDRQNPRVEVTVEVVEDE